MNTDTYWIKTRDDYGRSVHELYTLGGGRPLGVVVAMRRHSIPLLGYSHISNDWTREYAPDPRAAGIVVEHQSLRAAKNHLERVTARKAVAR